jgi:CrcB protein
MIKFLWVCLAGAGGTGARYLIGIWAGRAIGSGFPYGTLIVNLLGCFLIAGITHVALTTAVVPPNLRLALTTGFMGGLTTYSSFNLETTGLIRSGAWQAAAANFGITVGGCFAAGLLGLVCARTLFGP